MYKFIKFEPSKERYYSSSISSKKFNFLEDYTKHEEVEVNPSSSRIGGPIIDFPSNLKLPKLRFVAMLNLKQFSTVDPLAKLPKTGFL